MIGLGNGMTCLDVGGAEEVIAEDVVADDDVDVGGGEEANVDEEVRVRKVLDKGKRIMIQEDNPKRKRKSRPRGNEIVIKENDNPSLMDKSESETESEFRTNNPNHIDAGMDYNMYSDSESDYSDRSVDYLSDGEEEVIQLRKQKSKAKTLPKNTLGSLEDISSSKRLKTQVFYTLWKKNIQEDNTKSKSQANSRSGSVYMKRELASGADSGIPEVALMANLSHYGSDALSESKDNVSDSCAPSVVVDLLITKTLFKEHLKEKESLMQTVTLLKNDFKKEESRNIDREIALEKRIKQLDNINSVISPEPTLSSRPTKVEVPKELPKFSMVNMSLKKLKHHLAGFDMVVKERTTTIAITVGSWGALSFDQYFELNELKGQSQEKDTVIKKLKERIKSLSENINEDKVKKDIKEIETINIELDHRVSNLIAENEHLKETYKQL
ncbi:hypothetical protein Tco_0942710 [Tanacetum coccineum]